MCPASREGLDSGFPILGMGKATLTFDMDEERERFRAACFAMDLRLACIRVDEYCRSKIKYAQDVPDETVDSLEKIRSLLAEVLVLVE